MSKEILRVANLTKAFSGVNALEDVSLSLRRGSVTCLAGENGSGKSTLIKILSGVYTPDSGTITFDGAHMDRPRPIDAIRSGIQVIYQDFSLFSNLSVAENLAMNALVTSGRRLVSPSVIRKLGREALELLNLDLDLSCLVEDLPIADRQLVAIARALLNDARLIIMDEPTASLTQREIRKLLSLVRQLKKEQGMSFLFVSHKLDEVFEIADEIVVLRNGRLVAEGKPEEYDQKRLAREMTGQDIAHVSDPSAGRSGESPLIRIEHLGRPGDFNDVSFSIRKGEIVGLAGLLGSGRSALAHAIFGATPAESGRIYFKGTEITPRTIGQATKYGIAYVPNDRISEGLFMAQSVRRNLLAGTLERVTGRMGLLDAEGSIRLVDTWLQRLKINISSSDQPVQTLSGGNQQRVVLGRWLARAPEFLILNGPTVGVDIGSKASIHRHLQELAAGGMALIVISDEVSELLQICNRILVMKEGRLVADFDSMDLTQESLSALLLEDETVHDM